MTHLDFIAIALMAGLHRITISDDDIDENGDHVISIKGEATPVPVDEAYPVLWRYEGIKAFDIGAVIEKSGAVHILYESAVPDHTTWANHEVFDTPAAAWEFISAFLQAHPDE